jgi:hypothetical protein
MKTFTKQILFYLLILFSVFVLGIIFPTLVGLLATINEHITFQDVITSSTYWVFNVIGWYISMLFVNNILEQN